MIDPIPSGMSRAREDSIGAASAQAAGEARSMEALGVTMRPQTDGSGLLITCVARCAEDGNPASARAPQRGPAKPAPRTRWP